MGPKAKAANLGGHIYGGEADVLNIANFRAVRKASLVGIVSRALSVDHSVVVATAVVAARSIVIIAIAVELSRLSGMFIR